MVGLDAETDVTVRPEPSVALRGVVGPLFDLASLESLVEGALTAPPRSLLLLKAEGFSCRGIAKALNLNLDGDLQEEGEILHLLWLWA